MTTVVTYPWQCDDRNCQSHWHFAAVELADNGQVWYSEFNDGDWEPSDTSIPTETELAGYWKAYYRWCTEWGEDPLMQFSLAYPEKKVKEAWGVELKEYGGHLHVLNVHHRRDYYPWNLAPKHVAEFLCLNEIPGFPDCINGIDSIDSLLTNSTAKEFDWKRDHDTVLGQITVEKDVPGRQTKTHVRQEARKALRQLAVQRL